MRNRVNAGSRQERVDALARDIDMANANLVHAQQQFNRTSQLAATGFGSHQDLDKATAAAETGNANLSRAKERYKAARLGPTREERAIANAKVGVAVAAVAVIAARIAEDDPRRPTSAGLPVGEVAPVGCVPQPALSSQRRVRSGPPPSAILCFCCRSHRRNTAASSRCGVHTN